MSLVLFDSGGTQKDIQTLTTRITTEGSTYLELDNVFFYAVATDYVHVTFLADDDRVAAPHATYNIGVFPRSIFRTNTVANSGGVYESYDPAAYRGSYYVFTYPMTFSEFLARTAYPTRNKAVFLDRGGAPNDVTGWLIKAEYQVETGLARLELVSDNS